MMPDDEDEGRGRGAEDEPATQERSGAAGGGRGVEDGSAPAGDGRQGPEDHAPETGGAGQAGHESFMRLALAQALLGLAAGEVPVGAVVVADGRVAGAGFNQPIGSHDPTAHAEVVALREAARAVGNYRLTGATLYVTVEPCLMCVGAMIHARIGTLVFGATEPKSGAVVSAFAAHELPGLNHRLAVAGGVLEEECRAVIQRFFRGRRGDRSS